MDCKMDSLPLETLAFLLRTHLTVDELLQCRRVSKRFKFVIENLISFKTFAIYQHSLPINKIWFSSAGQRVLTQANLNQRMKVNSDFRETCETKLQILLSTMLANLRCLYVCTSFSLPADSLDGLEHLERLRVSLSFEGETLLSLPALQMLDLRTSIGYSEGKLILDAKKLTALRVKSGLMFGHLEFRQPHSITRLESPQFHQKMKAFTSLEYLFLDKLNKLDVDLLERNDLGDNQFLASFSKLKELHFNNMQGSEVSSNSLEALRAQLASGVTKIYLLGVDLNHLSNHLVSELSTLENPLTSILWTHQIRLLLSNYQNAAPILPFTSQINYCYLKDELIPDDFADKFVNLKRFEIANTSDPSHLFGLLKNCKNLVQLVASYTFFEQNFYNSLPNYAPRILMLNISIPHERVKCLNFDFLFGFKYLHNFQTNCSCGFDNRHGFKLIKRLFKELKFLSTFDCSAYGKGFLVKAYPDYGKYFLRMYQNSKSFVEFLYNLDQVEFLLYRSSSSQSNSSCTIF